jgi:hypothetical protein
MTREEELEQERDMLRTELSVYSEMLATVLHVVGPVVVLKGQKPAEGDMIDVDFSPDGKAATIRLASHVKK